MRRQVFCFVVGPGERDHGFRRGCGFTPASFFGTGPRQCNGNSAPRTTPGNPLLHPPNQPSWVQQTRPTPMLALQLALPRTSSPPGSSARRRWCPATASPAGGASRLRGELGGNRRVPPSRTPPGDGPYTDRLLRLVAQATCSSHPSPPPGGPPPEQPPPLDSRSGIRVGTRRHSRSRSVRHARRRRRHGPAPPWRRRRRRGGG